MMQLGRGERAIDERKTDETTAVSIVIPARNEEDNLGRLLASLARLAYPSERLDIIVIDHESEDQTAIVAKQWGARLLTKRGGTIASVRNFGAWSAVGQIVAFVDADCTVSEDWLDTALRHFADERVGAVGSYHLPGDASTWVRRALLQMQQVASRPTRMTTRWLPSGNMLVRRNVFVECSGFDESLRTCEDVDLCYRIAQRYQIVCDARIRCWHHGEPKTLNEMFRKELWRGRDNFRGVLRHGVRLAEIPSLVLPTYFLAATALSVTSPLVREAGGLGWWYVIGSWAGFLLPVLSMALRLCARGARLWYVPHFALFYAVYLLARGLAPFHEWRNT